MDIQTLIDKIHEILGNNLSFSGTFIGVFQQQNYNLFVANSGKVYIKTKVLTYFSPRKATVDIRDIVLDPNVESHSLELLKATGIPEIIWTIIEITQNSNNLMIRLIKDKEGIHYLYIFDPIVNESQTVIYIFIAIGTLQQLVEIDEPQ